METNVVGGFFMKQSERKLLWQFRIQTFHICGESSVAAWCAKQNVPVQSMYQWLPVFANIVVASSYLTFLLKSPVQTKISRCA
jgi:hypothetical protein